MNIQVRKAKSTDLPQILDLYIELQPLDPPIDASKAITVFEQAISCGVVYFVAENDGQIVGSCYISIIPNITRQCSPIGFIENVVVASEYQRRGIGRKLMNAAVKYAENQGCYKVTLQSGIKRVDAHEFYESIGFDGDSKRAFEIRF
jgi:GNAT superfamily N-acetyltransferase